MRPTQYPVPHQHILHAFLGSPRSGRSAKAPATTKRQIVPLVHTS
jgi:hypothetical protein